MKFCTSCGGRLSGTPPTCAGCGRVHTLDPKLAACVIFDWQGGVYLLRRAIEPSRGLWTFPGGFVDRGETLEQAAIREAREEAGVDVGLEQLLGIYSYAGQGVVIVVYTGAVSDGVPSARSESLEGASFADASIPWRELAFPSTEEALRDYLDVRRRAARPGISRNLVRAD